MKAFDPRAGEHRVLTRPRGEKRYQGFYILPNGAHVEYAGTLGTKCAVESLAREKSATMLRADTAAPTPSPATLAEAKMREELARIDLLARPCPASPRRTFPPRAEALISKTEAAISTETDPGQLRVLQAKLGNLIASAELDGVVTERAATTKKPEPEPDSDPELDDPDDPDDSNSLRRCGECRAKNARARTECRRCGAAMPGASEKEAAGARVSKIEGRGGSCSIEWQAEAIHAPERVLSRESPLEVMAHAADVSGLDAYYLGPSALGAIAARKKGAR